MPVRHVLGLPPVLAGDSVLNLKIDLSPIFQLLFILLLFVVQHQYVHKVLELGFSPLRGDEGKL